jgi:hypothetical protein
MQGRSWRCFGNPLGGAYLWRLDMRGMDILAENHISSSAAPMTGERSKASMLEVTGPGLEWMVLASQHGSVDM